MWHSTVKMADESMPNVIRNASLRVVKHKHRVEFDAQLTYRSKVDILIRLKHHTSETTSVQGRHHQQALTYHLSEMILRIVFTSTALVKDDL